MIFRDYIKIDKLDIIDTLSVIGNATFSRIKITEGAATNYVLVSDSSGTASWQSPKTVVFNGGGVTGSGTINYIPKWLTSTQLSSTSSVYDDGSLVGIGTITPSSKLHIKGNTSDSLTYSLKIDNSTNNSILYVRNNGGIQQGNTTATGTQSFSNGFGTTASGNYSHSEGYNTTSSGYAAHSEGQGSIANATYSHAEGITTWTSYGNNQEIKGIGSHAEGESTHSGGWASHAEGYNTTSIGTYSHTEGDTTIATGIGSHAEGKYTNATGNYSHAEGGFELNAFADYSHAEGQGTVTYGDYSHAEGYRTITGIPQSFSASIVDNLVILNSSYGNKTSQFQTNQLLYFEEQTDPAIITSSTYSGGTTQIRIKYPTTYSISNTLVNNASSVLLSGDNSKIIKANNSHTEGRETTTIGDYSHAEGNSTKTFGGYSHAEGGQTTTFGDYSHSEGFLTTAIGQYNHSEGWNTTTFGNGSHTEGRSNTTVGISSHSEGLNNNSGTNYSYLATSVVNGVVLLHQSYGDKVSLFNTNERLYIYDENSNTHLSYIIDNSSLTQSNTSTQIKLKDNSVDYGSVYISNLDIDISEWSQNGGNQTINSEYSHLEGDSNTLFGYASHIEGLNNLILGDYSHVEGSENKLVGNYSHIEGTLGKLYGDKSHIEGFVNNIGLDNGFNSVDITNGLVTLDSLYGDKRSDYDITGEFLYIAGEGVYQISSVGITQSLGLTQTQIFLYDTGLTIPYEVIVFNASRNFYSLGGNKTLYTQNSHSEGRANFSIGENSHSEGFDNRSLGYASHAEGENTISGGRASHSEGDGTISYGDYSHSEGEGTISYGDYSHSEGTGTNAFGQASHSEGRNTKSIGNYSHSEGQSTVAGYKAFEILNDPIFQHPNLITNGLLRIDSDVDISGEFADSVYIINQINSVLEQYDIQDIYFVSNESILYIQLNNALSSDDYGFVVDVDNLSSGYANFVFGNVTHSEGRNTKAFGDYSHASGFGTLALSNNSFIHSYGSTVSGQNSVVLGGEGINGTASNTVYVPNLNINFTPLTGTSSDNLLVRKSDGTVMMIPNTAPSLDKVLTSGNVTGNNNILLTPGYKIKGASASNNYISMGENGTLNNISIGTETTTKTSRIQMKDDGYMTFRYGPTVSSAVDMNKYCSSAFYTKNTVGTYSITTIGPFDWQSQVISIKAWFIANKVQQVQGLQLPSYSAEVSSLFSPFVPYSGPIVLMSLESSINETTPIFNSKVQIRTDGTNIILDVYQNTTDQITWKVFYEYIVGYNGSGALYE
jgi:hypothetical protein